MLRTIFTTLPALSTLLLATPLLASTSAPAPTEDPGPTETPEAQARIQELKKTIRAISLENRDRRDNREAVREQLEPLVAELKSLYNVGGPVEARAQLPQLVGVWQQLWTDNASEDFPPLRIDRSRAFQIITDQGYYYNVAPLMLGQEAAPLTVFLRGVYRADAQAEALQVKFTALKVRLGKFGAADELAKTVQEVEAGTVRLIDIPSLGDAGPVGNEAILGIVYLDDDFRISVGSSADSTDTSLFITDRVAQRP